MRKMKSNSMKKILLLLSLTILLVGIVSATETNKTSIDDDNKIADDSTTNNVKEATKVIQKNEKKIEKTATKSKTYNVSTYKALKNALISDYDKKTINIKANIKLQGNMAVGDSKNIIINGNKKTIDGANKYQFLDIGESNVTIKKLKIKNCHSSYGGAIKNYMGKLIIADSTFYNNNAKSGGAICNQNYIYLKNTTLLTNKATEFGGAIKNEAELIIGNCTFKNNKAPEGGAIYNQMKVYMKNVVFTNNNGGALSNDNQATIVQCTIKNNTAKDGVIGNSGKLTITKSTINNNKGTYYSAAINNVGTVTITDSKINNNVASKWDGPTISNNGGVLTIKRSTVSNNKAEAINSGGKATIYNCTINGNKDGVFNGETGTMTINKTVINNNKPNFGAIMNWGQVTLTNSNINNNKATGITNYNTGKMTINKCTINGNNGYKSGNEGGAIMNSGKLTVNDCTLSKNKATYGSALYNGGGTTTFNNCKLLYNIPGGSKSIYIRSGKVYKVNTIIK